ncbi:peroxide stress protein YaaA [Comamonas sp. J-3]|uniref:peroxide stress protein YaaA n=1 Tax=Comamonas trifloxystrobinivorans TaxID=3350256 RepID=UPI00372C48A6
MLFLLSPAKSLDYETPLPADLPHTQPQFVAQSKALIAVLRQQSPQQIASLMSISDKLAALNVARYEAWSPKFTAKNSRQAIMAFNGDVYDGLQAQSLSAKQLDWAQSHLCLLSGLYGVLRPLDWMQPYRLEMGTRLATDKGSNLYQYWGTQIADYLNQQQAGEDAPVVINLASQEYFKSVDRKALRARVVDCSFEDYKNGQYKIISFFAKRARGLMARYAIEHQAKTPAVLKKFNTDGYAYASDVSTAEHLVFRRKAD